VVVVVVVVVLGMNGSHLVREKEKTGWGVGGGRQKDLCHGYALLAKVIDLLIS